MEALPHPHPTQVRSACERCRKQKLRCNRRSSQAPSCIRCEELSLDCQVGPPRKVGRPNKKEANRGGIRKPTGRPGDAASQQTGLLDLNLDVDEHHIQQPHQLDFQADDRGHLPAGQDEAVFITPIMQEAGQGSMSINLTQNNNGDDDVTNFGSMDWILQDDTHLFNIDETFDPLPSLSSGSTNTPTTKPHESPSTVVRLTTNKHFWTLSRINMDLHELWETLSCQPANGTLEGFVCDCNITDKTKLKPYQSLMKLSQDYLLAIKALHKSLAIDARFVKPRPSIWVPRGCLLSAEAIAAANASPLPSGFSPAECGLPTNNNSPSESTSSSGGEPAAQRIILDSPTALLVISCFSQLVQHTEMFLAISQAHLLDPSTPLIPPADATFAGVAIPEFITQGAVFAEILRCNFSQMLVVLGLPTGSLWAGKTLWTGLLAEKRYQELLNHELGDVQGAWTARPLGVLHSIESCKSLLTDVMMSGCAG